MNLGFLPGFFALIPYYENMLYNDCGRLYLPRKRERFECYNAS